MAEKKCTSGLHINGDRVIDFWVMTGLERKLRLKQGAGLYHWAEEGIANRRNTEGAIINDTDPIDLPLINCCDSAQSI